MHSLSLLLPLALLLLLANEVNAGINAWQAALMVKVHLGAGIWSSVRLVRVIARHSAAAVWLLAHLHQLPQYDVLGVFVAGIAVIGGRLHQEWRLSRVKVAGL